LGVGWMDNGGGTRTGGGGIGITCVGGGVFEDLASPD
jgi:hypothetical protein